MTQKVISTTVLIGRLAEAQLDFIGAEQPLSDFNRGYNAALQDMSMLLRGIELPGLGLGLKGKLD